VAIAATKASVPALVLDAMIRPGSDDEAEKMSGDEGRATRQAAHDIRDPVEQRPSVTRLSLEAQDGLNVLELG